MLDRLGREAETQYSGLTDTNKRLIIPRSEEYQLGDLVLARCEDAGQNSLFGTPIQKMSIAEYHQKYGQDRKAIY